MKMYPLSLIILATFLALSSCNGPGGGEKPPVPDPVFSVNVKLNNTSAEPYKTKWQKGDKLEFYALKDGKEVYETITLSDISEEGRSAKFVSYSFSCGLKTYYAVLPGTGVTGCKPNEVWTISPDDAGGLRTVSLAKFEGTNADAVLNHNFALLKFNVADDAIKSVVLQGNNAEKFNFDAVISCSDLSVKEAEKPAFEALASLTKPISSAGDHYISLAPGINFSKGYTLTAYNASNEIVGTFTSEENLTTEKGKIYTAGAILKKPESASFTAVFEDTEHSEFKSSWKDGDKIEVCFVNVNNELITETIPATDISADGKSASFVSAGLIPAHAGSFYASIPDTGVGGYSNNSNWSTADMGYVKLEKPSLTVANCTDGSFQFKFRNVFSLIGFEVNDDAVKYVIFKGNADETVNKNLTVSFSRYAVNGAAAPAFTATKEIRRDIASQGRYFIPVYPGLKFGKGYSIYAYNDAGKLVGKLRTDNYLAIEGGKIYNAGEILITQPAIRTKVFDESKITASFAVISDVHIGNSTAPTNKFVSALEQVGNMAKNDSRGLGGVLVAGDLIDNPNNGFISTLKSAYESVYDPEKVPMIYTVGNHDVPGYAWAASMVSDAAYIRSGLGNKYFEFDLDNEAGNSMECRHCEVNGYHILAISPNGTRPIVYSPAALSWLDNKLSELTTEDPYRYVIVITHPMITGTVYGSLLGETGGIWTSSQPHYWATSALTETLRKYPQAVVFGGHLHFPLNDPRSVWQEDFTVAGCASVRYMAIEPGSYEDMRSATVMNDADQFSQGNFIQFDASGNMRLYRMDFFNQAVIGGKAIEFSYPDEDKSHLKSHVHATIAARNQAPVLSVLDVEVNSQNGMTAKFAAGKDDEFVHHYVLTLKKGASVVKSKKILADFYKAPLASGMKSNWEVSFGTLEDGSYELSLVAYDSWEASSQTLARTFTIGADTFYEWKNDEAGSADFSRAGVPAGGDGWLSYAGGKVSWTANESGRPRSATLTFPDGFKYRITQIEAKDFKGKYDFTTKVFAGTGAEFAAADPKTWEVNIGAPFKAETLTDADGTSYTNNIGVSGLFGSAILSGSVVIDYTAKTVKIGFFLDARDGSGQLVNGKYATFVPSLATRTALAWTSPWKFDETELGNPDYTWVWYSVSSDFNTLTYTNRANNNVELCKVIQYPDATMNNIIGMGVVLSSTNVFTRSTVSGYANVFQVNAKGKVGNTFVRK